MFLIPAVVGLVLAQQGGASHGADPGFAHQDAEDPPSSSSELATHGELFWGDFNGDGRQDLLVAAATGHTIRLFRNEGSGEFADITQGSGLDATFPGRLASWLDFDGDGLLDLLLVGGAEVRLWRNLGDETFADTTQGVGIKPAAEVLEVRAIDFDENGRKDLQFLLASGTILYRNVGDGHFDPIDLGFLGSVRSGQADGPLLELGPQPPADLPREGRLSRQGADGEADWASPQTESKGEESGPRLSSSRVPLVSLPACISSIEDQATGQCIQASSVPASGKLLPLGDQIFVDPTGKVGIANTSPATQVEIGGTGDITLNDEGTSNPNLIFRHNGIESGRLYGDATGSLQFRGNSPGPHVTITEAGDVGIGTSAPIKRLHVVGNAQVDGKLEIDRTGDEAILLELETERSWEFRQEGTGASTALKLVSVGGGGDKNFLIDTTGRVGIGTLTPRTTLDVNGTTTTDVLTITGGSDLVERFHTGAATIEAGTVMCIDTALPGQIVPSATPYDHRVAGVVSGAGGVKPGISMGQSGMVDGDVPMAMAGRVWVQCSTENGPIESGDLLTTSSTVGHAMRATDPLRSHGAVLGKGMSRLEEGTGLVLVLVNLQ